MNSLITKIKEVDNSQRQVNTAMKQIKIIVLKFQWVASFACNMMNYGGDKSKRAIKVIEDLEKEFTEEFKKVLNKKGHKARYEKVFGSI